MEEKVFFSSVKCQSTHQCHTFSPTHSDVMLTRARQSLKKTRNHEPKLMPAKKRKIFTRTSTVAARVIQTWFRALRFKRRINTCDPVTQEPVESIKHPFVLVDLAGSGAFYVFDAEQFAIGVLKTGRQVNFLTGIPLHPVEFARLDRAAHRANAVICLRRDFERACRAVEEERMRESCALATASIADAALSVVLESVEEDSEDMIEDIFEYLRVCAQLKTFDLLVFEETSSQHLRLLNSSDTGKRTREFIRLAATAAYV